KSGDLKDIGYELYMNMLEKAIVSVRGTDIRPVLRCEVDMGFGAELEGSVPESYMTCDEEERARQIDRLRVCNSFRELVRIAKEWVLSYQEMPTPVRRLFKHTHLHTACRLLGISALTLEYLPEKDALAAAAAAAAASDGGGVGGEGGGGGGVQGWASTSAAKGGSSEELDAKRRSHNAAVAAAAAAAAEGGGGSPSVTGTEPAMGGGGGERSPEEGGGGGRGKSGVGGKGRTAGEGGKAVAGVGVGAAADEKLLPFAVMRGPEVDQERWEV
ncbi:unnamed protein product, partial [Laminaria digitata]